MNGEISYAAQDISTSYAEADSTLVTELHMDQNIQLMVIVSQQTLSFDDTYSVDNICF